MNTRPEKCILLTDKEREAQEKDMKHYKHRLFHQLGAGELSNKCAYDFNRGWEYALRRFGRSAYCATECPNEKICYDRNHRV